MTKEIWLHMNLYNKILIMFVFTFLTKSFSQSAECKNVLSIENLNTGSVVYINNNKVKFSNGKIVLGSGKHLIKIVDDSLAWNKQEFISMVEFDSCNQSKRISFTPTPTKIIRSYPGNALVIGDGNEIGYTPLRISANYKSIILKKENYEDKFLSPNDINVNKPVKLVRLKVEEQTEFIHKPLFKILLGSLVTLGAVTAYFKIKADNKFDEYKKTKDQSFLDDTDKYDLISGITLGVMEINFGALLYYLLFD